MAVSNSRISGIQRKMGTKQTGFIDVATAQAVLKTMGKPNSSTNLVTLIKRIQEVLNIIPPTGNFGPVTLTRLEAYLEPKPIPLVPDANMVVSKKGLDMIVGYEVSSPEFYKKKLEGPILPGGASGITIGIGYDLGHNSKEQIRNDWEPHLKAEILSLLLAGAGLKSLAAQQVLATMMAIRIPFDTALQVYYHTTVPRYAEMTRKAFPGVQKLPPDAQAGILSLVFNRGASTKSKPGDDSRDEMAAIVPLVKDGNLKGIAAQFRKMKRLWQGKPKLKGLLTRREKEAAMIENASFHILPEDQVLV